MHENPSSQGHLRVCRWTAVVFAARAGVLVVAGAVLGSCVNLSYPPGASQDGSTFTPHRRNGAACTAKGDCQSGFCVDGVCCMTSCDGPCSTCAKGAEGFCMFADVGTNPRGACVDSTPANCGQTGVCDGAGACAIYPAGTSCKDASCPVHMLVLASRCDGKGTCQPGQAQSCSPYLCGLDGKCLTECSSDTDCENDHPCMKGVAVDGGVPTEGGVSTEGGVAEAGASDGGDGVTGICGKKALGTQCAADDECALNHCSQGVCCSVACGGGCQSCALKGNEGACIPVPGGMPQVPLVMASATGVMCTATAASTCGIDGTCDGAGGCRLFPSGTACSAASCTSAMLRNASTCDGKNHCQAAAAVTCGGYVCATGTTCKTTCAMDTDCASPSRCGEGSCGGLTAQYYTQTNLTGLAYMEVDTTINFNWMGGSPSPMLNVDSFSIRWTGKITARFSELYTFVALTDDGERLWINDKLIIDRFVKKPSIPEDDSMPIMMTAGQPVDFKLEYFEGGGDASAQLLWETTNSTNEPRAVIPTSALAPQ
jgi:hypothetical protein